MMLYELDKIERKALEGSQPQKPRPGEKIQEFWCPECKEWHRGSVLGGPVGDPHGETEAK